MYLAPWQIFAIGCVCGAFITVLVLGAVIIKAIKKLGVELEQEEKDNGK